MNRVPHAPIFTVTLTTQPPIPPYSAQMAPGDRRPTKASKALALVELPRELTPAAATAT